MQPAEPADGKPKRSVFKVPQPVWQGVMNGFREAMRRIVVTTLQTNPKSRLGQLMEELNEANEEIKQAKEWIKEDQKDLAKAKTKKKLTVAAIEEAKKVQDINALTQDEVDDLCNFLLNLRGIMGVMVTEDGSVKFIVRTAIKCGDRLYDMGDFEVTLPATGFANIRNSYMHLSEVLNIRCIRLPRNDYRKQDRRRARGGDIRLHHHDGEIAQWEDGTFYINDGYFCTGNRAKTIATYLRSGKVGDIKQGLSVLIACMNETQWPEEIPENGRLIPVRLEKKFFETAIKGQEMQEQTPTEEG